MTIETYLDQARQLNSVQRIELVQRLWDTIAADQAKVPLTQAQRAELDRRLAALDADVREGKSFGELGDRWDVVKRRITTITHSPT